MVARYRYFLWVRFWVHNRRYFFIGGKMNIKIENKLKLNSLINHHEKIKNTIYPDSYLACRESMMKILNDLIVDRSGVCSADYTRHVARG